MEEIKGLLGFQNQEQVDRWRAKIRSDSDMLNKAILDNLCAYCGAESGTPCVAKPVTRPVCHTTSYHKARLIEGHALWTDRKTTLHHVQQKDVDWLKEKFAYIDVQASEHQQDIVYAIPDWVLLLERTIRGPKCKPN